MVQRRQEHDSLIRTYHLKSHRPLPLRCSRQLPNKLDSTEEGNILTGEEQWNKLKLMKEVADEVWGE